MGRRHDERSFVEQLDTEGCKGIQLRFVTADDEPLFREAWERLSPRARYRRFLSPKLRLTPEELRYLTDVDQADHIAIGAVRRVEDREEGVGVARCIRIGDSDAAEISVTVIDELQGRGLGHALLERVVEAARARGIRRFICVVLPENIPMQVLASSLSKRVAAETRGAVTVEVRSP